MLSKPAPDYKVSDEIRVSHRDESFNLHMWNEVRGLDPYQRSRLTDVHFRILRSEHQLFLTEHMALWAVRSLPRICYSICTLLALDNLHNNQLRVRNRTCAAAPCSKTACVLQQKNSVILMNLQDLLEQKAAISRFLTLLNLITDMVINLKRQEQFMVKIAESSLQPKRQLLGSHKHY